MGDKGIQQFALGKGHRLNELHLNVVTLPKVDDNVCNLVVSVGCGCQAPTKAMPPVRGAQGSHGGPLFEWVCH